MRQSRGGARVCVDDSLLAGYFWVPFMRGLSSGGLLSLRVFYELAPPPISQYF